ncbi:MAG: L,D-transpeptidase [Acidimicrobiia bacterium]
MRIRAWLVVALAIAFVATACGGGGDSTLGKRVDPSASAVTTVPRVTQSAAVPAGYSQTANVKRALTSLAVYPSPTAGTPSMTLPNPWVVDKRFPDQTVQQVFLVKSLRNDGWVEVQLPVRPNGTTGWIRVNDVDLVANPFRITVELGAHRITVAELTKVLYQGTVAVGAAETPTPLGSYFIRVLVQAPDPTTVYGPYAYGLSSHSDALEEFNGGDAEIGIHGNDDASVLGSNVTHGCVRMDNDAITALSRQLPLGTPVDIVA